MTTVQEIRDKVADYLEGEYEVEEVKEIPSVEQVAFGKKAKKLNVSAFAIDLRHSTDLLYAHQKQTAGKVHKAFLHAAASTVLHYGGQIRSFKGDSLLALWPAQTKAQLSTAVRTAMSAKWLLDTELSKLFEPYEKIDFGIGIDWGEVFVVRAGLSRDANNNDLLFMGKCINFAVAISEQAKGPYHVEISPSMYANLVDSEKYGKQEAATVDMWKKGTITYRKEERETMITNWQRPVLMGPAEDNPKA